MTSTTTRTRSLLLSTALTLLLLVAVAPHPASAQAIPVTCELVGQTSLSLSGTMSDPIPPGSNGEMEIEFHYATSTLAWSLEPIEIHFGAHGTPSWAEVTVSPRTVYVAAEPGGGEWEGHVKLSIAIHDDAPENTTEAFLLFAEAGEGTCAMAAWAEDEAVLRTGEQEECVK